MSTYLFKSKRLGFRQWIADDLIKISEINRDEKVMKYFLNTISSYQTKEFIERMKRIYSEFGVCYFAVEVLTNKEFIGFIGVTRPEFVSAYTHCWDIGWRLAIEHWGKGYATEGANRCIVYGFETINLKTINVITKLGMQKVGTIQNPFLKGSPSLESYLVYAIRNK